MVGGAPTQQINTRARGQSSQADNYCQSRGRAEPWCRADYELDSKAENGKTEDQAEQSRNEGLDSENVENVTRWDHENVENVIRCDDGHVRPEVGAEGAGHEAGARCIARLG